MNSQKTVQTSTNSIVQIFLRYVSLKVIAVASIIIRAALLLYGEWQDENFAVKFTDVDYHVFSDAARHVLEGNSPFLRPTYRYSPLLAHILTPNHQLHFSFGKVLFVLCDLLVGLIIYLFLAARRVQRNKIIFSVSLWLLNPLTATVSSRGNAESILAVLVLLTLYLIISKRILAAGVCYGLSVHLKIFPIIYSLPLYLFINEDYVTESSESLGDSRPKHFNVFRTLFNPLKLKFAVVSALTFTVVTGYFYMHYGDVFLKEAYFYHVTRRDTRHNFSVYFYMLYLIQTSSLSFMVGLVAFLPQLVLLLVAALYLHRDIALCCFVQTFVFVTFNKVCTSQYFLWYLCLLPLITPYSKFRLVDSFKWMSVWLLGQGLWLVPAYLLEFQGYNTFIWIWLAGGVFFAVNVVLLTSLLKNQDYTEVFVQGRLAMPKKHTSKLK